jgi:hypothetical protein
MAFINGPKRKDAFGAPLLLDGCIGEALRRLFTLSHFLK